MTSRESKSIPLSNLVTIGGESIDPRQFPDKVFHLFSIPAYDSNKTPEIVSGACVGSVKRTVQPGDCLFSKLNPRINRVWVVPPNNTHAQIATPEFWPLRIKAGVNLLPSYLAHLLSWEAFREQVVGREEAATKSRSRLKPEQLLRKSIPVPPLAHQERIVRILGEAEELRKLRVQADRRTADLIPALFHDMFGDPAIRQKRWPIMRAGDLMISCEYGCSQKANNDSNGVPILRMNNIREDGTLSLGGLKYVQLDDSDLVKYRLSSGDVLFNRTNSRELVGKTGMWDGRFEAVAASYFIRVRFNPEKEHPQHFTAFMNLPFMKQRLAEMARGAIGQANISMLKS